MHICCLYIYYWLVTMCQWLSQWASPVTPTLSLSLNPFLRRRWALLSLIHHFHLLYRSNFRVSRAARPCSARRALSFIEFLTSWRRRGHKQNCFVYRVATVCWHVSRCTRTILSHRSWTPHWYSGRRKANRCDVWCRTASIKWHYAC